MFDFLKKRKYQLVVEFLVENMEEVERMFDCELKMHDLLRSGDIDGNDIGGGVFNLFIITREPSRCFEEALSHLATMDLIPNAAGYRDLDKDDYIRLWPKNASTPFELH